MERRGRTVVLRPWEYDAENRLVKKGDVVYTNDKGGNTLAEKGLRYEAKYTAGRPNGRLLILPISARPEGTHVNNDPVNWVDLWGLMGAAEAAGNELKKMIIAKVLDDFLMSKGIDQKKLGEIGEDLDELNEKLGKISGRIDDEKDEDGNTDEFEKIESNFKISDPTPDEPIPDDTIPKVPETGKKDDTKKAN